MMLAFRENGPIKADARNGRLSRKAHRINRRVAGLFELTRRFVRPLASHCAKAARQEEPVCGRACTTVTTLARKLGSAYSLTDFFTSSLKRAATEAFINGYHWIYTSSSRRPKTGSP